MPRVSIITALYNHGRYVAQAIESVLAQTYRDWEHILWDDGSADESLQIARRYETKFPDRIRVFTHPGGANLGQEATRNAAIAKASGQLLCLLDSDDLYEPRKLELLAAKMDDPKVGLAYGKAEFLSGSSGRRFPSGVRVHPEGSVFDSLAAENFICAGATLFRRECLERGGIRFDSTLKTCGEYPVWLAIARDWKVAAVPEVVACWRSHDENLGSKLPLRAKEELVLLFERLVADPAYSAHGEALQRGLTRKRYDYANALYQNLSLATSRRELWRVLQSNWTSPSIRLKAAALWAMAGLGRPPNRLLSRAKHRFWQLRMSRPEGRKC